MHTVYAYWNADQIASVLNAVAMIMGGGDYSTLMKSGAMVGLLIVVGVGVVKLRGEDSILYFIMLAMFYGTCFLPKTTVNVHDVRANTDYPVANVPLGLALFAAETSHIGKWMTESFETAFTPVDEERFSKTGMAFGSRLIEELQKVRADLPSLEGEMAMFVRKCVNPEFIGNAKVLDDLIKSTDLWSFIGANNGPSSFSLNPARSTFVNNAAMPCPDAYAALTVLLDGQTNNQVKVLGARVNPGNSMAATVILTQIPAVEATLLEVSRSAQDAVRQSIVANLLRDCRAQPLSMQSGCVQSSAAVAMAEESAKVSYAAMAKVAAATLPKLRNAIELITIGVFPVVFLLIVIAGAQAGMVLKSYVAAMFWVQLWAPLYAIINAMAVKSDKADLLGIVHLAGGTTLANMTRLGNEALSNQSIAGLLTISVPVIALALIKGGEVAMSGVVSSIMGPAQGAAQKAGDSIGQGNITGGSVTWGNVNMSGVNTGGWSSNGRSWDNTNANKSSTTPEISGAGFATYTNESGSVTMKNGGGVTGASARKFDVGGTLSAAITDQASRTDSSGKNVVATETRGASIVSTESSGSRHVTSDGTGFQASTFSTGSTGITAKFGLNWNSDQTTGVDSNSKGESSTNRGSSENVGLGLKLPFSGGNGNRGKGDGGKDDGARGGGPGGLSPINPTWTGGAAFGNSEGASRLDAARQSLSRSAGTGISEDAVKDNRSGTDDRGTKSNSTENSVYRGSNTDKKTERSAQVANVDTAGRTESQGRSNQISAQISTGKPNFEAMGGGQGPTPAAQLQSSFDALSRANNPEQSMPAAQRVANGVGASAPAKDLMKSGGVSPPKSPDSVAKEGAGAVDKLKNGGGRDGSAPPAGSPPGKTGAGPSSGGPAAGGAPSAGSAPPNLANNATPAFDSRRDQVLKQYGSDTQAAQVQSGALAAAGNAFQSRNGTSFDAAKNAVLPSGLPYNSVAGYASALTSKAAKNEGLRDTLIQISNQGGRVTPAQQDFINLQLRKP